MSTRRQPTPSPDKLEQVTSTVRELCAVEGDLGRLKDQEKLLQDRAEWLRHEKLPDLFAEIGVRALDLEVDGKLFSAAAGPYYHANIAASWPEEQRECAFKWLDESGYGDLIKVSVSVIFGRKEYAAAKAFASDLEKRGYSPKLEKGVPWNTLTAFLREQVEKYKVIPPLDLLGATIGRIVKIKEVTDE